MSGLLRFGNVAVDVGHVWAVTGDMVMLEGGHWAHLGEAACKAIVNATPFCRAAEGRTATPRRDGDGEEADETTKGTEK